MHIPVLSIKRCTAMQLVFRAANGDIIECGEEQGVTQGIVAGGGDDEDEEDTAGASHMHACMHACICACMHTYICSPFMGSG